MSVAIARHRSWYGSDDPPPQLRELRAGPLTVVLDGVELRYARCGEREVLRRVYPTVRDVDWKVVPMEVRIDELVQQDDAFTVRFHAVHRLGEIHYEWDGAIRGTADGTLEYTMDGDARSDFDHNRIGFVILHPELEFAGRPYRCRRDGETVWHRGRLPERIAPQFHDPNGRYIAITPWHNEFEVELEGGLEVRHRLRGALFETEDQRNWDNSLKSFCTPLSVEYPHHAAAGDRVGISIRVEVDGAQTGTRDVAGSEPVLRTTRAPVTDARTVRLGAPLGRTLPAIGFELARRPPTATELERLRLVAPDHLRVELHLDAPEHERRLDDAVAACAALDCALELCLHADAGDGPALDRLGARLRGGPPVARVLVWQEGGFAPVHADTTPHALLELVRERLAAAGVAAPAYYGSEVGFAQINKVRPDVTRCDGLYFAHYAIVHTSDVLSLCETFPTQREIVRSTRAFGGELPIAVSPITLAARRNYYVAPRPERYDFDRLPGGGLPRAVDPRQMSLFGAGWTLGTVAGLAGADSLTFYETTGWRGLMEDPQGCPLPERFLSQPGTVFPLFYVFADLARWKGAELVACEPNDELETAAVALRRGDETLVLVANLTASEQAVALDGGSWSDATVRLLDASTAAQWSADPVAFLAGAAPATLDDGRLRLELQPYATACVVARQRAGS